MAIALVIACQKRGRLARRWFLRSAIAAGVIASCHGAATAASPTAKPLFRFMQWNDTHVEATEPSAYPRCNERLRHAVRSLGAPEGYPMPDFIVGVGDLIPRARPENAEPDLAAFASITAKLRCPFYPLIGNHENVQREGDAAYESPFCHAFETAKTNYTFRRGNVLFVMINNSGAPSSNNRGAGRQRDAWVRRVLETSPETPKILCCHIPLVAIREDAVLKKSFGFASYRALDDVLLDLVKTHSDSIIAVLSGHLHLTGAVRQAGVYHIVASGTASYPSDVAVYDVFADQIHVRMIGMKKELLAPTDIHGKHRHGIDYTDATHPTHEAYVRGNPQERDFVIPLRGKKRVAASPR